jgi:hypothetical protein
MIAARNSGCLIRRNARMRRTPSSGEAEISTGVGTSPCLFRKRPSERYSIKSFILVSFSSISISSTKFQKYTPAYEPHKLAWRPKMSVNRAWGPLRFSAGRCCFVPVPCASQIDTHFLNMCNISLELRRPVRQARKSHRTLLALGASRISAGVVRGAYWGAADSSAAWFPLKGRRASDHAQNVCRPSWRLGRLDFCAAAVPTCR